jgi:ABC-2 type transport system permease protein
MVQTLIVFGIAYVAGARFPGAGAGVAVTVAASALISLIIASFSDAVALLVRQQEALIGISQFIVLPMQFLSSSIMDTRLSPAWVRHVARYNPVDWAVVASRQSLSAATDWGAVWPRLGLLAALAGVMAWLATRAFGAYQRSA